MMGKSECGNVLIPCPSQYSSDRVQGLDELSLFASRGRLEDEEDSEEQGREGRKDQGRPPMRGPRSHVTRSSRVR